MRAGNEQKDEYPKNISQFFTGKAKDIYINAKDEEIVNYERDQVEKNLKFLGLLIFVNKIKEKTF